MCTGNLWLECTLKWDKMKTSWRHLKPLSHIFLIGLLMVIFVLWIHYYYMYMETNHPSRFKSWRGHLAPYSWSHLGPSYRITSLSGPKINSTSLVADAREEAQRQRQLFVSAACKQRKTCSVKKDMFLVDDQYKAIYCLIPKSGCTMWKIKLVSLHTGKNITPFHGKMFSSVMKVHGILNKKNKYGIRTLNSYNHSERTKRLNTYFKYIIVRHPLVRLVSAYRQMFFTDPGFIRRIPDILNKVRPNWVKPRITTKQKSLQKNSYNFTFTEFLNYTFHSSFKYNMHFDTMVHLSSPCCVHYDYISKLETFDVDARHLLSTVYNTTDTDLFVTPHNTNTGLTHAVRYFKQVPEALRSKVIDNYRVDADMFGYSFDGFL